MQSEEEKKAYKKQYHKDNAEKMNEYQRQYYIDNKEEILKKAKKNGKRYRKNNRKRIRNYQTEYDKNHHLIRRNAHVKRTYGITLEEQNLMFDVQEGKCKICGKHQNELKQPLVVDHNHVTGKVRGLLCHKCNSILGYINDDIRILENAIEYLKKCE